MNRISYLLTISLLYPLSILPFSALYFISDILFFVFYHFLSYRRAVVGSNLRKAFPEKTEQELKKIEKSFYRHLCDLVLETIKLLHMDERQVLKHFVLNDVELFDELHSRNQSVVVAMGHYGNWEWAGLSTCLVTQQDMAAIYRPIKNKYFNDLVLRLRGKFGLELIPVTEVKRYYEARKEANFMNVFLTDQRPVNPKAAHWMTFLNQDTPVQMGAEKIARHYGHAVVFADIRKIKRGYYEANLTKITDDPRSLKKGEITEMHTRLLEKQIRRQPEFWLWSHKRWKHRRN